MTLLEAFDFVQVHCDDDDLDPADIDAAFTAIFQRDPDDEDREAGLWSMMVVACNEDE
jgi:hypothetical protein